MIISSNYRRRDWLMGTHAQMLRNSFVRFNNAGAAVVVVAGGDVWDLYTSDQSENRFIIRITSSPVSDCLE